MFSSDWFSDGIGVSRLSQLHFDDEQPVQEHGERLHLLREDGCVTSQTRPTACGRSVAGTQQHVSPFHGHWLSHAAFCCECWFLVFVLLMLSCISN